MDEIGELVDLQGKDCMEVPLVTEFLVGTLEGIDKCTDLLYDEMGKAQKQRTLVAFFPDLLRDLKQ